jgi:type IV pilus assembly protein PilC
MAASKAAVKSATAAKGVSLRNPNPLQPFMWEGVDKRGTKMKGESLAKNANLLKAELRKQGITPAW